MLPVNFEVYEGKSKNSQQNEDKPLGTLVMLQILECVKEHLARTKFTL